MTPESVLDQLEHDADALKRRGLGAEAERLAQAAADFREALEPITLVPEHTAMMRSGKTKRWLRDRFDTWRQLGAAAVVHDERWYRLCVLPSRLATEAGAADADAVLRASA